MEAILKAFEESVEKIVDEVEDAFLEVEELPYIPVDVASEYIDLTDFELDYDFDYLSSFVDEPDRAIDNLCDNASSDTSRAISDINDALDRNSEDAKRETRSILEKVTGFFKDFGERVKDTFKNMWDKWSRMWESFGGDIYDAMHGDLSGIMSRITDWIKAITEPVNEVISEVFDFLDPLFQALTPLLETIAEEVGKIATTLVSELVKSGLEIAVSFAKGLVKGFKEVEIDAGEIKKSLVEFQRIMMEVMKELEEKPA